VLIKIQKIIFFNGYILFELKMGLEVKGSLIKIIIDKNKAITPPNLLGIDRRIA